MTPVTSGFWQLDLLATEVIDLGNKYRALADVSALPATDQRKQRLRAISRRWPASLRELEMIGAHGCEVRRNVLLTMNQPLHSTGELLARGQGGLALMWMLHALLRDILAYRQSGASSDLVGFLAFIDACAGQTRWPASAAALRGEIGERLDVRAAYLRLSAWAKWPLEQTYEALFERTGGWIGRGRLP